jgi:probable rRNA maturation factor
MEGAEGCEVSVLLTDDAALHHLNRTYRDRDRPTDVLSFAQRDAVPGCPPAPRHACRELLGDVVISVDAARRQADDRGVSLDSEIAHLAAHGTLHLIGYDDATPEGAVEMEARAQAALAVEDRAT